MQLNFLSRLFPRRIGRRELELAYLNASVTMYDLERRQREIDCGLFRDA